MATAPATITITVEATALTYRHRGLPLWIRVGLYALENADQDGIVTLEPRALITALDPTLILQASSVSRAIATAVSRGVLHRSSTARRLVLP